jgi:hypothetical protein
MESILPAKERQIRSCFESMAGVDVPPHEYTFEFKLKEVLGFASATLDVEPVTFLLVCIERTERAGHLSFLSAINAQFADSLRAWRHPTVAPVAATTFAAHLRLLRRLYASYCDEHPGGSPLRTSKDDGPFWEHLSLRLHNSISLASCEALWRGLPLPAPASAAPPDEQGNEEFGSSNSEALPSEEDDDDQDAEGEHNDEQAAATRLEVCQRDELDWTAGGDDRDDFPTGGDDDYDNDGKSDGMAGDGHDDDQDDHDEVSPADTSRGRRRRRRHRSKGASDGSSSYDSNLGLASRSKKKHKVSRGRKNGSLPSASPSTEDGRLTSPELSPTALCLRNEQPSGAHESAEPRVIGESVLGVPIAVEMNVDVVAGPGSNEEHTGNEDLIASEKNGPGGSGDDEGDDSGGALPFDDGGGEVPMVDAGGDGGEGPPTLTEGVTGAGTGPEGSATDGASVPPSVPTFAVNGTSGSIIDPVSTARGPSISNSDNDKNNNSGSAQPDPAVLLARAQGAIEVHVQEKKDLHDKLDAALVRNTLLQERNRVLEEQQQQQQLHSAVQALATDSTTQAREEEPDGPIRRADADRLRQLEAANSKLEEDLRELEELDRERDAATEARAKQLLEACEKLRGDLKAEKQAHEKGVGELERQLNERGDRHKTDLEALSSQHKTALAALASQHEKDLAVKQKMIQEQEQLIKKYKQENEELKKRRASVKAEPGRDPQPDQQRSSSVSVKTEPECDLQPDQQRSSGVSVTTEPGCDPQPDQQRSSNDASLSSPPKSKTKVETGAAGTGEK